MLIDWRSELLFAFMVGAFCAVNVYAALAKVLSQANTRSGENSAPLLYKPQSIFKIFRATGVLADVPLIFSMWRLW